MKSPLIYGMIIVVLLLTAAPGVMAADNAWIAEADLLGTVDLGPSWQGIADLTYQPGAEWSVKDFYLQYHQDDFLLRLGRADLNWGPGEESMIVDDRQGFNMLYLAGNFSVLDVPVHWEQFWAGLNPRAGSERRLFGHRYEAAFGGLTLGGSETVVLSGDWDRSYYLPFIPYYGIQHLLNKKSSDSNTESNIVVQFDFDWRPDDGSRWYGAVMIDDAPTNPPNDDVPGRVGLQWGFDKPGLIGDWGLCGEYTGITRYAYTYLIEAGDYTGPELLIGHPLGPDADRWRLELFRALNDEWNLAVRLDLERHGEGGFGDRWTLADGGGYHFMEGVVERDQRVGVQVERRWGSESFVRLLLGYEWIDNADHQTGAEDRGFYGELGLRISL